MVSWPRLPLSPLYTPMRKKKTRAANAGTRATGTAIAGETIPSATSTPRVHEATVPPTSTAVTAARGTPSSTNRCDVWSVPPMKIGRPVLTRETTTRVVSNTAGPTSSTSETARAEMRHIGAHLERDHREEIPEEQRTGIAHEDPGRVPVVQQEREAGRGDDHREPTHQLLAFEQARRPPARWR